MTLGIISDACFSSRLYLPAPSTVSLPLPYPAVWLSSSLESQGLPKDLGSLGPETQEALGLDLPACVFAAFLGEESGTVPLPALWSRLCSL